MIEKLGGRKALGSIVAVLVGVGMVLLKGDVPPNMLTLVMGVFGAFVMGNIGEHTAAAFKAKAAEPSSEPINMEPITQALARLEQLEAQTQQAVGAIIQHLSARK